MASAGRPRGFSSDSPIGSGRAWGSLHLNHVRYLVGIYFVSIDARAQVAIILLACGPRVVIENLLGQVCTLGKAPRRKETFPDFHEWCRVTRHSRIFHGLTGCQRTPRVWGVIHFLK